MDNLTHTLAGWALAETGLKRGTRHATATLLIGANLPDLDGLVYLGGRSTDGLMFRRGWTHGILAMVVLPLLWLGLMLLWSRWRRKDEGLRPGRLLLIAALGVWSHPLLDLLNTYGVRLLMPFSARWFYGDALFIIDPWVWAVLLIGIAASRRQGPTAPAGAGTGRPAGVALTVVLGYAFTMALSARYAAHRVEQESADRASRTLASPVAGNPLRRTVVRELEGEYERGVLRLLPWDYVRVDRRSMGRTLPGVSDASRSAPGRAFLSWARFPVFRSVARGDSLDVTITDARYEGFGDRSWASVTIRVSR